LLQALETARDAADDDVERDAEKRDEAIHIVRIEEKDFNKSFETRFYEAQREWA
jgi:hypothetical protein